MKKTNSSKRKITKSVTWHAETWEALELLREKEQRSSASNMAEYVIVVRLRELGLL